MRIFVTGSDGSIGSTLVKKCQSLGIDVVGADVRSGFDIRDRSLASMLPAKVDAVVHLAALSNDTFCKNRGYDCFDTNVLGTLNLMDASQEASVGQFIFASTEWVYDQCDASSIKTEDSPIDIARHSSEYALSKLVSEANLRQRYARGFCPTTILRFGIVCGTTGEKMTAVESLFFNVMEKDEVSVGSLASGRCFVHISDVVSGIIQSIGLAGFEIINLSGDSLVTLGEIIRDSMEITARSPHVVQTNPSDISVRNISNEKAKRVIGWKPQMTVRAWLEELNATAVKKRL